MPLLSLASRLLKLLTEFPEQPILELLLKLVRRCLSLPARSPPARYLAGAELLLAKMTDWEKVASSRVTLKEFFPPLARVVLRLRRIEVAFSHNFFLEPFHLLCDLWILLNPDYFLSHMAAGAILEEAS